MQHASVGFSLLLLISTFLIGCARPWPEGQVLTRCEPPPSTGEAITATWLGVAGVFLSDGETGILIDPFVSRSLNSLTRLALGRPLETQAGTVRDWSRAIGADTAAAVLVTHSHYDHILDAAAFADHADATVHGSATTKAIVTKRGHDTFRLAKKDHPVKIGDFTVTFVEGRHGEVLLGHVLFRGSVSELPEDAAVADYRMGEVYGLHIRHALGTIVYTGSAAATENMFPEADPEEQDVVAILALIGRDDSDDSESTATYLEETVGRTGADMVIPIHFDDLFRPPERPTRILGSAEIETFVDVLSRDHPDARFAPLPLGQRCAVLPISE